MHKKWVTIVSYFRPLEDSILSKIKDLLSQKKNVLLLIRKKEYELAKERELLFKEICAKFPLETKTGQLILSLVPDIEEVEII